jgi:hypothetical protein
MKTKLHHFAYNIRPGTLETVIEFFQELNFSISYQEENARWCLVKQASSEVNIQIIETDDEVIPSEKKLSTHIAFLSDNPKLIIKELSEWATKKGIIFRKGAWTEQEFWFDLPRIFTNFVIEIMDTSVVE